MVVVVDGGNGDDVVGYDEDDADEDGGAVVSVTGLLVSVSLSHSTPFCPFPSPSF